MIKGKSPAFQFYPSDFLSDENVVLMSNTEVGCYIKLLCFCWKQGSIPSGVSKIAKLCGENSEAMAELWQSIEPCFRNGQPDRLIHPRLEIERKKQASFSKERSESGKKGADARWGKKDESKNGYFPDSHTVAGNPADEKQSEIKHKDGSAIQELIAKNGSSSSSSSSSSSLKKRDKGFTPPSEQDVIDYFKEKGYRAAAAKKAFEYYNITNWKDSTGKQVKSWKQKMWAVWCKPENKIPEPGEYTDDKF